MTTFVICRDSDVNKLGGRVSIAEGDDGYVDVGGFFDGLGIGAWVGHDDEARFFERASDVVREIARCEATSNSGGTSVGGKLQDSTLTIWTS